jgi:hypothetical protein
MARPALLNPAEVDRVVEQQVRSAAQAVTVALRAVERTHTARSRRVARHLAGVLRMLRDTGRVTSPFDAELEPTVRPAPLPEEPPPISSATDTEELE